ncbi:MAG: tol-pal system protein YbgF [Beijerinckiaceae bacterium]|jgi:tol-pal system protein YbgF
MLFNHRLAIAALVFSLAAAAPGLAQDYNRPPASLYDQGEPAAGGYRGGADPSDPGALSVRIGKLEGRIRDMTGQIEELQNANRKLVEQVQKFQADVEFRLQDKGSRPSKRTEAAPLPGETGPAMDADAVPPAALKPAPLKPGRNDSFDPDAAPSAPGAPKALGSTTPSAPEDAPLDLAGAGPAHAAGSPGALAPTLALPSSSAPPAGGTVTPNGTVIANAAPNPTREEFDIALGYYRDKQYESAEKSFSAFIEKNPKSRLVADATFYIGETFAQRGRPREAAEQYLKISTDFATSPRAPEAMLRLGVQLKALGAKEQACATFTEIGRKYPNAPAYVKTNADREAKRAQC